MKKIYEDEFEIKYEDEFQIRTVHKASGATITSLKDNSVEGWKRMMEKIIPPLSIN